MANTMPTSVAGGTLRHLEELVGAMTGGVILIDLSGAILWANDAALSMHGLTEAAALGTTADDYAKRFTLSLRNGHRLISREYPLMRALAGESFPDLVVDVGPSETGERKWTHHVRDVVMTGDDGEPDCIALVIHDVSDQFEAEERFERMFQANPAPAIILRLADQRYIRANRGFLEMVGQASSAIIGRSLSELDILRRSDRADFARQRLADGQTIPQMEAELPMPDKQDKLVILAGQPIEIGDDKCMLFTFADLEPRRKAERSLRESEAHFSTLFRMAPVAMVLTSPENHRMIEANEAFWRLTRYAATSFLGRAAGDPELWADVAERNAVEAEIEHGGGIRNHDVRILDVDNVPLDCLLSAERMVLRGERCTLWLFQDITARRHSELELVDAIEAVMKDASWFSRSVMDKLALLRNPACGEHSSPSSDLTPREREVLELICEGLDDKGIAQRLQLSGNTVRNHVAGIYGKIGVNRRTAAVAWARERGLA